MHGGGEFEVIGVLGRRAEGSDPFLVESLEELLSREPGVVVECASHDAVVQHAEAILRRGVDLILISTGALADAPLHRRLQDAALRAGSRLILAPGAMGGLDALAAARLGGLSRVCYRGRKPPVAWRGTAAEQLIDLGNVVSATLFYRGNAREAALSYPKNSNVAATVALAGLGFERTEVELIADPEITGNLHELSFEGSFGRVDLEILGSPSPGNPKTSVLTAYSILRILTNMRAPLVL